MQNGGNSLFDHVKYCHKLINNNQLSIHEYKNHCKIIFKQICNIVNWIHSNDVCHMDISLENTLIKMIVNKHFTNSSPLTLVGAANINTQKLDIFKMNDLSKKQQLDVLMATSAIPILFKPREINKNLYVDGGTIENEIIYQVLNEYPADYYNFTYICSTNKQDKDNEIDSLFEYTKTIASLFVNNYIYDIAKIKDSYFDCKKGKLNVFYPTSEKLNDYSFLDFDNGDELIKLSKESYNLETINFC